MQLVNVPYSAAGSDVHQPVYIIQRQLNLAVKTVQALSILQIIIGCLSVLLGILLFVCSTLWGKYIGFGIWSGVWIIVSGGLGVGSAKNPTNSCLNGVHMAFNIISCCLSVMDFGFYICLAVLATYETQYYDYGWNDYGYRRVSDTGGIVLYIILSVCMLAEFIIALTASIYCCKAKHCCQPTPQGMIVQQPDTQHHIVTQNAMPCGSTGQTQLTYPPPYHPTSTAYSPQQVGLPPHNPTSTAYSPQQVGLPPHNPTSTAYYPHQGQFAASTGNVHATAPTSVTYAQSMPPTNQPANDKKAVIQDEVQPSFKYNKL